MMPVFLLCNLIISMLPAHQTSASPYRPSMFKNRSKATKLDYFIAWLWEYTGAILHEAYDAAWWIYNRPGEPMADIDEYKKCMGDVFCWPRNKMRWHLMYPWTSRPSYGYRRDEQHTENPNQVFYSKNQ